MVRRTLGRDLVGPVFPLFSSALGEVPVACTPVWNTEGFGPGSVGREQKGTGGYGSPKYSGRSEPRTETSETRRFY